ncbi:thiosulfate sulfurtransferase cysA2 [Mycobacterium tuberculosis]|nr:thiosulfate sulfurtransferase cysA2 [Mycobacterium tuberculosis]
MARCDVLVSADWAESNLHAPKVVFVEVDEDTSAYDRDHIAGAIKLDWRTPTCRIRSNVTSSTPSNSPSCCPSVASPTRTR